MRKIWLLLTFPSRGYAFMPSTTRRGRGGVVTPLSAVTETTEVERPPCFYKSPSNNNKWTQRLELAELTVGQELPDAVLVQELLNGKTGPKVFVDCGVGRFKKNNNKWQIQTAMLRLGSNSNKISVTKKRAARLRKKAHFPVFVSRIRLENDQLEVSLNPPPIEDTSTTLGTKRRVSIASLSVNQSLEGTVKRVEDYGVLVDVGANREALLHIQSVADALGHYVHKAEGLRELGLKPGAVIDVTVKSREKKRVFLDLVVAEAEKEETSVKEKEAPSLAETEDPYAEEAAAWAATEAMEQEEDPYAEEVATWTAAQAKEEEDPYADEAAAWAVAGTQEEDEDPYAAEAAEWAAKQAEFDEDRDIEDAMGLGTYS